MVLVIDVIGQRPPAKPAVLKTTATHRKPSTPISRGLKAGSTEQSTSCGPPDDLPQAVRFGPDYLSPEQLLTRLAINILRVKLDELTHRLHFFNSRG